MNSFVTSGLLARVIAVAAATATMLVGCVVEDRRPMERIEAQKATTEIPQDELLDVGVRLFDANVPADQKTQEKEGIYPDVRKAESRYMPVLIRDTLESTGQWGQVRVLPRNGDDMDVYVDGKILQSDGRTLKLDVVVTDASGRTWYRKVYEGQADTRAYKDGVGKPRDPFENVYNTLANDMLQARKQLTHQQRAQLHQLANLRFSASLAPYAFSQYYAKDRNGTYTVTRLPADDDPVVQRMQRIRERDYSLVDTLNEYYANFGESVEPAYTAWRKSSYEELEALSQARREALTREILGAVAVVGGIVAGTHSSNSAESAASTAAVIGGIYAFKAGLDKNSEIKTHDESLKQLNESFQNEVQPMVVDVEGRTLQLKGSAEEQYAEWRQLLRELYENETGQPATTTTTTTTTTAADNGRATAVKP